MGFFFLRKCLLTASLLALTFQCSNAAVIFPQPGWQAVLSTGAHNVSGTVTILDSDSLVVNDFTYDGGGLDVYFYLGTTDQNSSFSSGLEIGPQLLGTVFNGSGPPLVIDLPSGQNFNNFGAISVWCTAAGVSFGSGTFTPVPEPTAPLLLSLSGLSALCLRRRK